MAEPVDRNEFPHGVRCAFCDEHIVGGVWYVEDSPGEPYEEWQDPEADSLEEQMRRAPVRTLCCRGCARERGGAKLEADT